MVFDVILFVLGLMIFYDFSLHLFPLLRSFNITTARHPFGLYLLFDYLAKDDEEKRKKCYELFWTGYCGLAFVLFLVYVFAQ